MCGTEKDLEYDVEHDQNIIAAISVFKGVIFTQYKVYQYEA